MLNKNILVAKQKRRKKVWNWELGRVVGRCRWVNVVEWLMKTMMMTFPFGFKLVGFLGNTDDSNRGALYDRMVSDQGHS